ncbi:MAG: acetyl-CoA carboxylase biotin carboxyl carrier protein [Verrucomicrobia bacterium]|nr:acetyl-CoA carboxylase biotin carboxyl carrier protein [Verrucomicrobiota bacterium]
MDIKKIRQIVDIMKRADLSEFQLEEEDFKLRLQRQYSAPAPAQAPPVAAPPPTAPSASGTAPPESKAAEEGKLVTSPMVGTFYAAPSPESPPFVKPGDAVTEDTVVCILEAMKVMNEIKAEEKGTIAEVLVGNGDSVEYGQPLFRLR